MTDDDQAEPFSDDERRFHDRSRLIVDVHFEGGESTGVASSKDISLGGLYMSTQTDIPVGSKLAVRIPVNGDHVVIKGEVVYANPGKGVGVTGAMASTWAGLSQQEHDRYQNKLSGIYGHEGDEAAYNALNNDKREALKLLSGRLIRVDLWQYVGRIVNVYGVGGVGMYFSPLGDLAAELDRRSEFTRRFARHHDNSGGFLEKGRKHVSLHFLYIDPPNGEREWHVHLDLYGGWGSMITAVQHLYWERWKKYRPDWRIMKQWAD